MDLHVFDGDGATIVSVDYEYPALITLHGSNDHKRQIKAFEKWNKHWDALCDKGGDISPVKKIMFYGINGKVVPPAGFRSLGLFDKARLYTCSKVILKIYEDFEELCRAKSTIKNRGGINGS